MAKAGEGGAKKGHKAGGKRQVGEKTVSKEFAAGGELYRVLHCACSQKAELCLRAGAWVWSKPRLGAVELYRGWVRRQKAVNKASRQDEGCSDGRQYCLFTANKGQHAGWRKRCFLQSCLQLRASGYRRDEGNVNVL